MGYESRCYGELDEEELTVLDDNVDKLLDDNVLDDSVDELAVDSVDAVLTVEQLLECVDSVLALLGVFELGDDEIVLLTVDTEVALAELWVEVERLDADCRLCVEELVDDDADNVDDDASDCVDDDFELDELLDSSVSLRARTHIVYVTSPPLAPSLMLSAEAAVIGYPSVDGWCSSSMPPARKAAPLATVMKPATSQDTGFAGAVGWISSLPGPAVCLMSSRTSS